MSLSTLTTLFDSPLLRVTDIVCRHPRGGCGCERGDERTHLTMIRRNGFGYHARGKVVIGDSTTALLYRGGDSYRISHPFEDGDECTAFEIAPEHEEEVFGLRLQGRDDFRRSVSSRNLFACLALHSSLKRGFDDALAVEESASLLCESVLRGEKAGESASSLSSAAFSHVQRAREAIQADLANVDSLDALAAKAGCSPFYLARIFRKATGFTLAEYRTRLRIAYSLDRLAQGESDLSALAQDLGFSHHSHFSSTFRRCVGMTPSAVRASLRANRLTAPGRDLIARAKARR
ncbi:AraC family transcriptional regulator [Rhodanobacter sp. L36]|uniref:helix-turn-helix domain-containing protein n=1 Tax=Rhodanobacter sp. L36 TaxID=1747221 RepID=UPI00131E9030|nr:AraC family transcriptional regulator [Rhodanobacter sp. L36]